MERMEAKEGDMAMVLKKFFTIGLIFTSRYRNFRTERCDFVLAQLLAQM